MLPGVVRRLNRGFEEQSLVLFTSLFFSIAGDLLDLCGHVPSVLVTQDMIEPCFVTQFTKPWFVLVLLFSTTLRPPVSRPLTVIDAQGKAAVSNKSQLQRRRAKGTGRRESGHGGRLRYPDTTGSAGARPAKGTKAAAAKVEEEEEEEEMLVEVEAKVCRSILSADITELQFLEACPGASYVKEFSVWNK